MLYSAIAVAPLLIYRMSTFRYTTIYSYTVAAAAATTFSSTAELYITAQPGAMYIRRIYTHLGLL
jgi:hypothetical protein